MTLKEYIQCLLLIIDLSQISSYRHHHKILYLKDIAETVFRNVLPQAYNLVSMVDLFTIAWPQN